MTNNLDQAVKLVSNFLNYKISVDAFHMSYLKIRRTFLEYRIKDVRLQLVLSLMPSVDAYLSTHLAKENGYRDGDIDENQLRLEIKQKMSKILLD